MYRRLGSRFPMICDVDFGVCCRLCVWMVWIVSQCLRGLGLENLCMMMIMMIEF